jgi:predicted nucleic acid-binding protein
MADCFFDTSALVKRYLLEIGSAWVVEQCRPNSGNTVFISQATLVEAVATFCRKAREQNISQRISEVERDRLIAWFRQHTRKQYNIIRVTSSTYTYAGDLCRLHKLRAYDALQLACALTVRNKLSELGLEGPIFITADLELLSIAYTEGLPTKNPGM